MKRKISILLLVISLLFLTACTGKNSNYSSKFTKSGNYESLTYKYPSDAVESDQSIYRVILKENEYQIMITNFKSKTVESIMNDTTATTKGTKKINNREWSYYEDITQGVYTITYAYQLEQDSYTVTIISEKDIHSFVESFMNEVSFK